MEPHVSVVITTYKRPVKILRRSLISVINQTYNNLDIIIVNDYPNDKKLVDEIKKMINSYQGQRNIKYIVLEKNSGACKARNKGLENSTGEYIAFLDDDDEWLPDKIEKQVIAVMKDKSATIVYSNFYYIIDSTNKTWVRNNPSKKTGYIFDDLLMKNIIGSCSVPLIKTDAIKRAGGFREDMPALQDWELYLRIMKNSNAIYLNEPLLKYHIHEEERISTNPSKRTIAYEKLYAEFKFEIESNNKIAASFYMMGMYFYSINKQKKEAYKYYALAVKRDPLNIKRNFKDFFRLIGRDFINKRI